MQEYREEYKKKSKADCKNDYKNDWIPVSTPEEQGIPSIAIVHFLEQIRARDLELHSLQVIRNGIPMASMRWQHLIAGTAFTGSFQRRRGSWRQPCCSQSRKDIFRWTIL